MFKNALQTQVLMLIALLLIKISSSNFQEMFIKASSFIWSHILILTFIRLRYLLSDPSPYVLEVAQDTGDTSVKRSSCVPDKCKKQNKTKQKKKKKKKKKKIFLPVPTNYTSKCSACNKLKDGNQIILLLFYSYLSKNWQNLYVPHYIFVPTKIFEVPGICAVQEMSEFILLSEKRCHSCLLKKVGKGNLDDVLKQKQGLVPFRLKCMWKRIIVSFKIS